MLLPYQVYLYQDQIEQYKNHAGQQFELFPIPWFRRRKCRFFLSYDDTFLRCLPDIRGFWLRFPSDVFQTSEVFFKNSYNAAVNCLKNLTSFSLNSRRSFTW